jgi:hypothetical protein
VSLPAASRRIQEPSLSVRTSEQIVFDWSRQRCAPGHIPDAPARAFKDADGRIQVILAHTQNRRLIGKDLRHLQPDCRVVLSSSLDADPSRYDDRQWIHSVYTADGHTVLALVHDEYQGNQHTGRCRSRKYRRCWYNSVTLAVSRDKGLSYTELPGPAKLVASVPYRYVADIGPVGVFSPSNIVRNPRDGYFYALVRVISPQSSLRGTCVIRTGTLFQPKSWRAWDGSDFSLEFVDPYVRTDPRPRVDFCTPVSHSEIVEMSDSLTYNTYLGRFLLVGVAGRYDPLQRKTTTGIFFSLSDDLIHWTERRLLIKTALPWTYSCGDKDPLAYPSVIDPTSTSRSFDTSGQRPYLYFTRFHYESCQSTLNRDLVRVQIAISK